MRLVGMPSACRRRASATVLSDQRAAGLAMPIGQPLAFEGTSSTNVLFGARDFTA